MLYFAYGSNLNVAQMARRCPAAVKVGPLVLPRARLVFRGVADVIPDDLCSVQGGVWRITPKCLRALDVYEGCRPDDSGLYFRDYFPVSVNGEREEVLIYRMNADDIHPPSPGYAQTIRQGYRDFGLDVSSLNAAITRSYDHEHA